MATRRSIVAAFIVVILLGGCFPVWPGWLPSAKAQIKFDIPAPAAILVDYDTGQILWEKNANEHKAPASITKIMTMLLIMEALDSGRMALTDVVTASRRAASFGGSNIYLKEGERMTVEEMLKAIAIFSANDASVAMAEYLGGSVENFVAGMNDKAKKLGLKDTYFQNPEGLPAPAGEQGNYSTAYEISAMARALVAHPRILKFTSIRHDTLRGGKFMLDNTNGLIGRYQGADGLKTGHTEEAGWSLVSTAKRNGIRLIGVVLDTASDEQRMEQSALLLDYGFRSYTLVPLVKRNAEVARFEVSGGGRTVVALAKSDLNVLALRGSKPKTSIEFERLPGLKAPVEKGRVVGKVYGLIDGKRVGYVDAVAQDTVKRANIIVRFFRWLYLSIVHLVTLGRK